ncbi:hypothetical protein NU195Hw_g8453t1 [Hortaea werneckii]
MFLLRENAPQQNELPATQKRSNRVDNVEDFLALAERGQATLSDAFQLLRKIKTRIEAKTNIEALPKPQKREKAARVGAGRILLWIWNHRETLPLREIRQPFANVLVWFLHTEGLEEFIWNWIILEVQNVQSQNTGERSGPQNFEALSWCDRLLGGLVAADASWSSDGSLNGAVLRLLKAAEHFGPQSPYRDLVSLISGGSCAEALVQSRRGATCDPVLFEQLVAAAPIWGRHLEAPASRRPKLFLYHPTKPDGVLWFHIVYDVFNHLSAPEELPSRRTKRGRVSWRNHTLRAAYILRLAGDDSKATYLEEILRKHFSDVRPAPDIILNGFRDDVRLQRLRRTP